MLSPRRIHSLPIHTYFNDGVGEYCYIDGVRNSNPKGFYNILNDFDFIFPYTNTRQSDITVFSAEAWNGSTCLSLSGSIEANQV
jgi:hypothetical protein